ncbi:hypothetical protein H072_6480 [Dactylellina haptotyla CBS 200.50]|uniref:rRNA N-glycosylase n=1 Tax=Dactylellina haptotyla (strain CBS 200.50) TaxID=1284197 RepID=S8AF23_DACHA|nr:hypothetical protein H072_6480 [Dactylellina haptotyla CBS 200.50]
MRVRYFVAYVGVAVSLVHALPGGKKAANGAKGNEPGPSRALPSTPAFNAEFTFKLDAIDNGGERYQAEINRFRTEKGELDNGVLYLPHPKNPPEFFDVVLETTSSNLDVKLQKDNLYLLAYRSNDGWREVKGSELICSTKAEFPADYPDLEKVAAFDTSKGLKGRYNTRVGKSSLETAIDTLLSNKASPKEAARAFLVLTQMLPESIRIREISEHIGTSWGENEIIPFTLVEKENGWKQAKGETLGIAKRPEPEKPGTAKKIKACKRGKRDICIPELEASEGQMGNKKQPQSNLNQKNIAGSKPKLSELKAFGGKVSGGVGVLGAVVITCALSEPLQEESKKLRKRIDVLAGFLNIPSTVFNGITGGLSDLFNGGNGDAFMKSVNDGLKAGGDLPGQIGEQFQKAWSKENWESLVRSADKGVQAFLDAPGQVGDQITKAWSKENREAFVKSTGDLVKAIRETPALLECGLYDLREAAEDVVIAFQKAPQQVASELQKFDRGLDNLGPDGKKAFYAITGSLGVFAPSQFDEIGYMAPGICHIVNSIGIPKFQKSPVSKCPLVISTRFNRVGEVVRTMFMIHKGATGSNDKKAFWDKLELSVWGKLAYLEIQGRSDPSLKSQSEKAWTAVLDGHTPSDLPEVSDDDKLKLWAVIVRGQLK